MKLATALSERSDLQKRIAQLQTRLGNNAKVQEGEKPAEDPQELLKELDACLVRLEELIARINLTNAVAQSEGETMTQLLARRDVLRQRLAIMRTFLDQASSRTERYARTEIKIQSTVDVRGLQKDVDALAQEMRQLEERIQEINYTQELL